MRAVVQASDPCGCCSVVVSLALRKHLHSSYMLSSLKRPILSRPRLVLVLVLEWWLLPLLQLLLLRLLLLLLLLVVWGGGDLTELPDCRSEQPCIVKARLHEHVCLQTREHEALNGAGISRG